MYVYVHVEMCGRMSEIHIIHSRGGNCQRSLETVGATFASGNRFPAHLLISCVIQNRCLDYDNQ